MMKKIQQLLKGLFSRTPICKHEHKTEISRAHAGYLIADDGFPQFVSHVVWKCDACGQEITYIGTEIV